MRKNLVRAVLVTFMAVMGFLGGGVQFDGVAPSFEQSQTSAMMNHHPDGCDRFMFGCTGTGPDPWGLGG